MCFFDLSGCSLIGLASSIAIAASEGLTSNEVNTLAAFFSALGDNFAIISAQMAAEESNEDKNG